MPRAYPLPRLRLPGLLRTWLCAALLTWVMNQPQVVTAQPKGLPETARDYYAEGQQAYEAGRYEQALEAFQRAYEFSEAPLLLFNIGQAADRLRLDSTALQAFKLYLDSYPEAPNNSDVESRIRALEGVVGTRDAAAQAEQEDTKIAVDVSETLMPSPYGGEHRATKTDKPLEQWWFWAGVGGVVVLTILVATIAASGGDDEMGKPVPGDDGLIVITLSLP